MRLNENYSFLLLLQLFRIAFLSHEIYGLSDDEVGDEFIGDENRQESDWFCIEAAPDSKQAKMYSDDPSDHGINWADFGLSGGSLGAFALAFRPNTSEWAASVLNVFGSCGVSGWGSQGIGFLSAPGVYIQLFEETLYRTESVKFCWIHPEVAETCRDLENIHNFLLQITTLFEESSALDDVNDQFEDTKDYLEMSDCL